MHKHESIVEQVSEGMTESVHTVTHAAATIADATNRLLKIQTEHNRRVWERHPFMFGLLGTFGIVTLGTGFQDLVHTIPLLKDNPIILIVVGVIVLFFTGALYKRLQQG